LRGYRFPVRYFLVPLVLIFFLTSPIFTQDSGNKGDAIVYVTKTGTKYHSEGCRYSKSATPIKLSEASGRYSPCSICNPPVLEKSAKDKAGNDPPPNTDKDRQKGAEKTVTVYVTKSGTKYHKDGCRSLSKSRIPMSLEEAQKKYSPCSVCNPPTSTDSKPDGKSSVIQSENKTKKNIPGKGVTVYVTKSGKKYHRAGCRSLSKSKIPISLEDAKGRYTPCSVCNPPQ
jgi:hypothetical protein